MIEDQQNDQPFSFPRILWSIYDSFIGYRRACRFIFLSLDCEPSLVDEVLQHLFLLFVTYIRFLYLRLNLTVSVSTVCHCST